MSQNLISSEVTTLSTNENPGIFKWGIILSKNVSIYRRRPLMSVLQNYWNDGTKLKFSWKNQMIASSKIHLNGFYRILNYSSYYTFPKLKYYLVEVVTSRE